MGFPSVKSVKSVVRNLSENSTRRRAGDIRKSDKRKLAKTRN
jgi:hypothetical protein